MKAYVTLLGTKDYFDGVLGLYQSLKEVGAHYPLVCAVTSSIPPELREALQSLKIEVVEVEDFIYSSELLKKNKNMNMPHWNGTAGKFSCFGLDQFEKIVFVDCDMMVMKNIDHLFDMPHMTAAPDSPEIARDDEEKHTHYMLNAGLIVIQPSKEFSHSLMEISLTRTVQDQDALRLSCPDWVKRQELHLPQSYNVFTPYWDKYKNTMRPEDVTVLHFIGPQKPWNDFSIPKGDAYIQMWYRQYLSQIMRAHQELNEKFDFFKDI